MRKYLFLLLLVSAVSANAQTFDEADLVGTWTTPGLSYTSLGITNIESISLGAGLYTRSGMKVYTCGLMTVTKIDPEYDKERTAIERVPDYYITNNNKLHIWNDDDYVLNFIIEELTATTLKVKTYDGQSYSFTKDGSSGGNSTSTRSNGDVNGDGVVNAADVVKVVDIISGN